MSDRPFDVSVTLPALYPEERLADAVARAADAGADGFEFFDWAGTDLDALTDAADAAGLAPAATLAAGAGSSIDDPDGAMTNPDATGQAIADVERSVEVAADLGCPTLIVTVGPEQEDVPRERQREAVLEVLRGAAPAAEDAGVELVVEPLNVLVDHPGYFLVRSADAFELVGEVDSPNVSVLYDVYHQQVTEGNLIGTIRSNVDQIGHVHVADVPGRHEPGTGEIDYPNVLAALADAGYEGDVGCECFPTGDPDEAVASLVETVRSL